MVANTGPSAAVGSPVGPAGVSKYRAQCRCWQPRLAVAALAAPDGPAGVSKYRAQRRCWQPRQARRVLTNTGPGERVGAEDATENGCGGTSIKAKAARARDAGYGGEDGAGLTKRWPPVRGGLGSQAPDSGRYGEPDECCLTYGGVTGEAMLTSIGSQWAHSFPCTGCGPPGRSPSEGPDQLEESS